MKLIYSAIALVLSLYSCKSFELSSHAKNPDENKSGFEQVGIISLFESNEQAIKFEGVFMEQLAEKGISASSTASQIAAVGKSREQLLAYLKSIKVDAILVCRQHINSSDDNGMVLAIDRNNTQSKYDGSEQESGLGNFYNTIYPSYQFVKPNGEWKKKTIYRIEVTLYEANEAHMIWQAFSPQVKGKQMSDAIPIFTESVATELIEQKLINPTKPK